MQRNIFIYCLPINEQYYVRYAEKGLRRLGHTVHNMIDLPVKNEIDVISYIKSAKIDHIIFFGFSFMNHLCHQPNYPFLPTKTGLPYSVIWHDNPFRYFADLETIKDTDYRFFCCDSKLATDMTARGMKTDWLPTFYDSDIQYKRPPHPEFNVDIAFAGTLLTWGTLLNNRKGLNRKKCEYLTQFNRQREKGKYFDYVQAIESKGTSASSGDFNRYAFSNLMEQKHLLRHEMFDALSGQDIHVWGQGDGGSKNIKKHKNLNQHTELPFLYSNAKVNLSIELLPASVHQRIMECVGCNGFILFEDKEDNDKCFDTYEKWSSLEELADKTKYFVNNDSERERIANLMHEEAKKKHDCHTRMEQMMTMIAG